MPRKLEDAVVVITGASSGIGATTAHQMAARGTRLVLAARGEEALEAVRSECEQRGAEAIAVPTDVGDESAVARLADDIHVVTILPQAVDTPMWRRAGNFSGREIRPLPLPRSPDEIAKRIVWCAEDPKREVTDRRFGRLVELTHAVVPPVWEAVTARVFGRLAFGQGRRGPSPGNLFDPVHDD